MTRIAPLSIKGHVKNIAQGLSGFYGMPTQTESWNKDICSGFKQLTTQLQSLIEVTELKSSDTAEHILACQHLVVDLTAYIQSLHIAILDRLTDIQSLLLALQETLQRLDRMSTEAVVAAQRQSMEAASAVRRQKIRDVLSHNGLFIVGYARTGTSILQTALNTSPEIFLLGEANLHFHHDKPGFAKWYRTMHEMLNNTPSKSTFCPDPNDPMGDAWDVLLALRQHYRLVGDKIALRPRHLGYDFSGAFRFLQDYFSRAHIIGTLRNPCDVLASNAKMFRPDDLNQYLISYLECLALEIDLICTFDRATVLVHENISPDTFVHLGDWLECDLRDAYARYYEPHFSAPRHTVPDCLRLDLLDLAENYYRRLKQQIETAPFGRQSTIEIARIRMDLRADLLQATGQACPV